MAKLEHIGHPRRHRVTLFRLLALFIFVFGMVLLDNLLTELMRLPAPCELTLPWLYIVTPTYPRAEQLPDLTRLGQTLKHLDYVTWIISEDSHKKSVVLTDFLNQLGIPYVYLLAPMPEKFRTNKEPKKPRGVSNRNAGLKWVRDKACNNGVIYFADDDNSYDLRIFQQIRTTKRVAMFPVGFVGDRLVSGPIIKQGRFQGFYDGWPGWPKKRKYQIDMAGFAVNVGFYRNVSQTSNVTIEMPFVPGFEEDGFLNALGVEPEEFEILAGNATDILVWHTQTVKNKFPQKFKPARYAGSNILKLYAKYSM